MDSRTWIQQKQRHTITTSDETEQEQPLISTILSKKRTYNIPESCVVKEAVGGRHGSNWPSCKNKLRHPQSKAGQSPGRPSKILHLFDPSTSNPSSLILDLQKRRDVDPSHLNKGSPCFNQSQTPIQIPKEPKISTSQEAWKTEVMGGNQIWVCLSR